MEVFEIIATKLVERGLVLLESSEANMKLAKGNIAEVIIWGTFAEKYDCNIVGIRYARGADNDDWNVNSVFRPAAYIIDFPKDASWFFRRKLFSEPMFRGIEPDSSCMYLSEFELRCSEVQIPEAVKQIYDTLDQLCDMWKKHAKKYLDHLHKIEKEICERLGKFQ